MNSATGLSWSTLILLSCMPILNDQLHLEVLIFTFFITVDCCS